jgi:hypothetical protein
MTATVRIAEDEGLHLIVAYKVVNIAGVELIDCAACQ